MRVSSACSRAHPIRVAFFAQLIEDSLHFGELELHVLFAGVGIDVNGRRFGDQNAAEGSGNLKLIPASTKDPFLFARKIETKDGLTGLASQQDGADLGLVARPTRAVDGEGDVHAAAQAVRHFHQRSQASAGTGASRRAVTMHLNKSGDVLSVEILRRHHDDPAMAQEPRPRENPVMPQREDGAMPGLIDRVQILSAADLKAQRFPHQVDQPVTQVRGQPNLNVLPARPLTRRIFVLKALLRMVRSAALSILAGLFHN